MMKKAQAAIEYLIILAVVVVIALIVIGVIGGFPGMTRGISERESASYWATADIGITRYFVNGTLAQLVVRNNKIFQINLTSLTFDASGTMTPTSLIVSPGASTQVNVTTSCGTAGSSFSKNVRMYYIDPTYGTNYSFTGEKPLVGSCQ